MKLRLWVEKTVDSVKTYGIGFTLRKILRKLHNSISSLVLKETPKAVYNPELVKAWNARNGFDISPLAFGCSENLYIE